jgi:uncharacterized membrane protein
VPGSTNRRAVRWLRAQLPELVASGAINSENALAIERYYGSAESRSSFAFTLLASIGSALVGAGIILLIAHNWDEFSRGARSTIAFLPLLVAQGLGLFVLLRCNGSSAWRESVAIFNIASVGTAISLISQAYQIQGSFADFMFVWMLLSIPMVYLFQTIFGAIVYIIGCVVWLFARVSWFGSISSPNSFWFLLILIIPYFALSLFRDRLSRQTTVMSIFLLLAMTIGLGFTAEATGANIGAIAFAGLFGAAYLLGMNLSEDMSSRVHPIALLAGIGIGVTAIVLSFQGVWHFGAPAEWILKSSWRGIGIGIELLFPIIAVLLFGFDLVRRKRIRFSISAAAVPLIAAVAWIIANLAQGDQRAHDSPYSLTASLIFDIYTLLLGVELIGRAVRANSLARANFGLLVIAALAISRFFDTDFDFVTRAIGFIIVGAGFLIANIIFFRKRALA